MNVFGYNSNNIFDQDLNTDDSVSFTSVTVTDAISLPEQLATKNYVDTHGGGGGGGNMTYTGTTPATNYIYKALTLDGHDAIASSIKDIGSLVTISNPLKCTSLDGLGDSGNLQIGNTQDTVDIIATNGLTANKVTINAGTNQEYMMADGSLLTSSGNAGNSNFYLFNNVNGISIPPPANGQVMYNATTLATTTVVYISHRTRDGTDIDVFLALINTLNDLYIQDQENSTNFAKFNIISAPTLIPNDYISIPVAQSGFGGNGNTAFGVNHNILVSFFSNTPEIDSRLSALEIKTQNQTAVSLITTFDDQITVPTIRSQAIKNQSGNPLDSISIGMGDYSVKLDATNGVRAYSYELYSGTASQFLKGNGVPDTNTYLTTASASSTYLPLAGGTMTGNISMGGNKITSAFVPVSSSDLCNKTYVDSTIGVARAFSFSPNGDPLSQLGTANFLGASYTVQSFYNPTTFKVVSINIYRTSVTSNTSQVAIYTSSNIREGVATLIGSTATTLSYVFSTPITLTGNAYYYCAIQSSATSGIYAGTTTGTAVTNSGLNASISYNKVAFVGVTLPSTLPTSGGSLASFIYPPFTMTGTTF